MQSQQSQQFLVDQEHLLNSLQFTLGDQEIETNSQENSAKNILNYQIDSWEESMREQMSKTGRNQYLQLKQKFEDQRNRTRVKSPNLNSKVINASAAALLHRHQADTRTEAAAQSPVRSSPSTKQQPSQTMKEAKHNVARLQHTINKKLINQILLKKLKNIVSNHAGQARVHETSAESDSGLCSSTRSQQI